MTDEQDWPDVERRDPPETTHVSVDALSNGARKLAERWFRWALGALAGVVVTVVGSAFGLGVYLTEIQSRIDARPTTATTRALVDSVKADLTRAIAAGELRTDGTLDVLAEHSVILERLKSQGEAMRRDLDRHERIIE